MNECFLQQKLAAKLLFLSLQNLFLGEKTFLGDTIFYRYKTFLPFFGAGGVECFFGENKTFFFGTVYYFFFGTVYRTVKYEPHILTSNLVGKEGGRKEISYLGV